MNVICVYRTGQFRNRQYSVEDVVRLYMSVGTHSDREFTFYCLTDSEEWLPAYIHTIPLLHGWPGWWSKMELGRPDLLTGRTLYLDLDSQVVGNLKPVFDYDGDVVMFDSRIPEQRKPRFEKNGWICRYQNATILFDAGVGKMVEMYNRFKLRPSAFIRQYRGDQDLMGDWFPYQPTFPKQWMIKLDTCQRIGKDELNPECVIVTGRLKNNKGFKNVIPWVEQLAR